MFIKERIKDIKEDLKIKEKEEPAGEEVKLFKKELVELISNLPKPVNL